MDSVQDLILVGFSHRTAPVNVREQYAVRGEDLEPCLRAIASADGVDEACVLSTCNRTEVLVIGTGRETATALARQHLFRSMGDEHLYAFEGVHAVIHLFRVAGGLDSLVLGESEILAQVKHALDQARKADAIKRLLHPLLTHAIAVGKRIRTETELGRGTLSVARVGVDVAKQVFGSLEAAHALIIGAGETAQLVARHLASERVGSMDFANRTLQRAELVASEFGGVAYGLGDLKQALLRADLVVACIDGDGGLVGTDLFSARELNRRARPMLVVDLSVPRAVDRRAADLGNLLVYDLDDLEPVVESNLKNRGAAMTQADEILVAEVHKFLALRTYAAFSPVIGELAQRFDTAREQVLDTVAGGSASAREMQIAHELVKKLLDIALSTMKEGARNARSEAVLDREYQRFLDNLESPS
ncbi:MAG: glutamyl-tRNA reductase [bacterium]|nr:glutamyl-tRNA reductase [bacterium]